MESEGEKEVALRRLILYTCLNTESNLFIGCNMVTLQELHQRLRQTRLRAIHALGDRTMASVAGAAMHMTVQSVASELYIGILPAATSSFLCELSTRRSYVPMRGRSFRGYVLFEIKVEDASGRSSPRDSELRPSPRLDLFHNTWNPSDNTEISAGYLVFFAIWRVTRGYYH